MTATINRIEMMSHAFVIESFEGSWIDSESDIFWKLFVWNMCLNMCLKTVFENCVWKLSLRILCVLVLAYRQEFVIIKKVATNSYGTFGTSCTHVFFYFSNSRTKATFLYGFAELWLQLNKIVVYQICLSNTFWNKWITFKAFWSYMALTRFY